MKREALLYSSCTPVDFLVWPTLETTIRIQIFKVKSYLPILGDQLFIMGSGKYSGMRRFGPSENFQLCH